MFKSKFRDVVLLCRSSAKDIVSKAHPMNLVKKDDPERNSIGNYKPCSKVSWLWSFM